MSQAKFGTVDMTSLKLECVSNWCAEAFNAAVIQTCLMNSSQGTQPARKEKKH